MSAERPSRLFAGLVRYPVERYIDHLKTRVEMANSAYSEAAFIVFGAGLEELPRTSRKVELRTPAVPSVDERGPKLCWLQANGWVVVKGSLWIASVEFWSTGAKTRREYSYWKQFTIGPDNKLLRTSEEFSEASSALGLFRRDMLGLV